MCPGVRRRWHRPSRWRNRWVSRRSSTSWPATALATRPRLLLLDEVLAGLNPQEIAEMIPVVQGIANSGVTVLMIEHVMQAVMSLAQEVWVLAQGQLIAHGTPADVTNDKAVVEAYLGHGAAERLQKSVASATAHKEAQA